MSNLWPALRVVVFVGALVLSLAACSSTKSDSAKPAELQAIKDAVPTTVRWRVAVGRSRGNVMQPAVLENAIYAAAADGSLLRVAPENGEVTWRVDTGSKLSAGVGSDGFVVAVASPRGEVLTYGADGKALWKAQVSSDVLTTPLVGRGLVIVRSTDHRITAFEADTGKRRWTFARTVPPLTLRATSDLAYAGDNVLVGLPGGRLVALALTNGAVRWEAAVGEPKGATEVERLADVIGALAVDSRDACAAAYQGRLTCVDSSSGNLRWARDLAAGAGAALDTRQVYGVDARGTVVAYTRDDGATLWRNTKLANRQLTTPLALPSALVVGDYQGYLHFLSPSSGQLIGRVSLSGAITAAPRSWAGAAVVQTQSGTLALVALER